MKKHFIMALMAAFAAFSFCSCGDDDDSNDSGQQSSASKLFASLKDNQVGINNRGIYNLPMATLDVTRSGVRYDGSIFPGNYHFMFFSDQESKDHVDLIMSLTPDMVNRIINLSSPSSAKGELYLTFSIDPMQYVEGTNQFHGAMSLTVRDGKVTENAYAYEDQGKEYAGTVTEGTIAISHNDNGATVELQGKLSNGSPVAFRGFVPVEEIRTHDYR